MKKIIILLTIVLFSVFGLSKIYENINIQEKISKTKEDIEKNNNDIFTDIFWKREINGLSSYFKSWKNLEITSMDINIIPTKDLDKYRPNDYYTLSKNNDYLNKFWIDNFINNFKNWKLFILIPINWYLWIIQDYSIYETDLKDYFQWNIKKLLEEKTKEYWEIVNYNESYEKYLNDYKNNFEKYYEFTLEVNSSFTWSWEITYFPYYDNNFYDWNHWIVWNNPYESFIVDNSFYPYINLAEINNKKAEISTINIYEKYFDKSNLENSENIKKNYYKITYYNKKYTINWFFKKWKNIIKINMFQFQRKKIWYINKKSD